MGSGGMVSVFSTGHGHDVMLSRVHEGRGGEGLRLACFFTSLHPLVRNSRQTRPVTLNGWLGYGMFCQLIVP